MGSNDHFTPLIESPVKPNHKKRYHRDTNYEASPMTLELFSGCQIWPAPPIMRCVFIRNGVMLLEDGTIAGSANSMPRSVHNLIADGIPLGDLSRMTSPKSGPNAENPPSNRQHRLWQNG